MTNIRFEVPPHTPDQAAVAILNICMHTIQNKLPWHDAKIMLAQFVNDAYATGYQKAKDESAKAKQPLPEVQVIEQPAIDKTA